MRSDIVPGGVFPDYELPDHTGRLRRLSEIQGEDPMVIVLAREAYSAKDQVQHEGLVQLWREQSPTIFFITHSIEEAVFLGDHIMVFSNSPGTVLQTIRVPPPDRPSIEMQRQPKFQETVLGIREMIDRLESSNRAGD